MDSIHDQTNTLEMRQRCHRAVSLSDIDRLDELYGATAQDWDWSFVRKPETGLVMARGRIGGGGAPFNLGEVSVTRASVRLENGAIGHAMVQGRDQRKAAIAAVFDAGIQVQSKAATVLSNIIEPLEQELKLAETKSREEAAATKVEFFTMVRGDD